MDQSIQSYLKPELDEASKVLLRAADLVEDGRLTWVQGSENCRGSNVCAAIAIQRAADGTWGVAPEARARFAAAVGGGSTYDIWHWNDAPGRTQAEVVAKLRSVALGG